MTRPTPPETGRRPLLSLAAGALAAGALAAGALATGAPRPAAAQPARRITFIVPSAAGGSTDVIARLLAEPMGRSLDRTIVTENVTAGATTVASARTAASAPDGSTVLVAQLSLLASPFLFNDLPYDTRTAFAPVGLVNTGSTVLVGRKALGRTPAELLAWTRANGGRANIGNGGLGSSGHLCALLLARTLGIRPAFVAYRGGAPAMNDLVGGTLDLVCDQSTNAVPQIEAGAVAGVLVAGPARIPSIPDVPTAAELGLPEVNLGVWHGLYVPRATPRPIVDRLNAALRAALADPAILARFRGLGTTPFPEEQRTPEAHEALFRAEYDRLGALLPGMGVTPGALE